MVVRQHGILSIILHTLIVHTYFSNFILYCFYWLNLKIYFIYNQIDYDCNDTYYKKSIYISAISGIGSIASAVKGAMVEYFESTVQTLKIYLQSQQTDDGILLLTQSMDTLGSLARAVGPTNFVPRYDFT